MGQDNMNTTFGKLMAYGIEYVPWQHQPYYKKGTCKHKGWIDELVPRPDLVVKVVEDAGNSHLLEKLILANIGQCSVVCRRPHAALHQDGQGRTVEQRCNGDQTKQVDSIDVLQAGNCVGK